jgi:lipopolysaccharide export system permease protein
MKTVRRLLYGDIISSVLFVSAAFLSLFFFIDFVDQLGSSSKGYSAMHAALYAMLELPGHLYELLPIAVLIGTIYTLSRLAQSCEFTILRTGGLGPAKALSLLMSLGLAFGLFTFILGDYAAPLTERIAVQLQARFKGGLGLGRSGAWLKDRQNTPEGERFYSINVGEALSSGDLRNIQIFEFDDTHSEKRRITAQSGRVSEQGTWDLKNVAIITWPNVPSKDNSTATVISKILLEMSWASSLPASVVNAAVLPDWSLSTFELFRYISHLTDNEQTAQRYELKFWKRALYPLACLVMIGLALPFAYLHARSGGISLKVFGGIMLGISFILLNNVAAHLGLLKNWTPWLVAATPGLIYLAASLAAFGWLVRYR